MLKRFALGLIGLYQRYLRPVMPASCRFMPSCSEYAREAISKYGLGQGILLAAKRLLCCHPFCRRSGYDPLL